ncbi:MAG: SRPBCC family protein [Gammaproteobacteria bacterium]|nr:SRPBCC family protein [Gammaproteobacteria bacterium]MDH4315261.1 SRPBCC family protein [Gammaproteobacteria bacterium]MDH5215369.1 SRPBCC family protein [Gammaproteobacteria bacterium]MDH5501918.1 SRPBCC family protein [Gammaproteobacteria bacterium]
MQALRKILIGLGGFALLVFAIAIFLPSRVRIERRIVIDAPAATIFSLANDFRQVGKWSPWQESDPNARYTITGPPRGVGATLAWEGNIVGKGSQKIIESAPYSKIVSELELGGRSDIVATFQLSAGDMGTQVVWSFDADFGLNLPARYTGLLLDGIVGDDYEAGLQNLKTMAERMPRADFSDTEIEIIVVEAQDIAYLSTTSIPLAAAISDAMRNSYSKVLGFIDQHKLTEAGAPISISRGYRGQDLAFDAAIPVHGISDDTPRNEPGVKLGHTYAGPVIRVKHVGSYLALGRTHDKIAAYLAALGIERNGDAWESYVVDATRTAEADLVTYVYYPIRDSGNLP